MTAERRHPESEGTRQTTRRAGTIPPHSHLPIYYTTDREKRAFVDHIFDKGAAHYELASQALSFGTARWYRRFALTQAGLRPGMNVLDVASGTGLVARAASEITNSTTSVIALEPSIGMATEGRKATAVPFVRGLAEGLPFRDQTFDFVVMGYALRHVPDLIEAFLEFRRVLRPGGRVLILEISRPSSRAGLALVGTYLGRIVPFFMRMTTRSADAARMMRYYWETIESCVPSETILRALRSADLVDVERKAYARILVEYHGRRA